MTCNCPPKNIIVYFFKSSAKPFNYWHNALSFFFFHKASSVLSTFITSHCPLTMWCIWLGYQLEKAFSTPESKLNGQKVIKDGKELNCLATTFQQKGKTHKQITKNQPPNAKHASILRCSGAAYLWFQCLGEARGPSKATQQPEIHCCTERSCLKSQIKTKRKVLQSHINILLK